MHPLLNIAFNAARQAADIILRNRHQVEHLSVTTKPGAGPCSEVDLKAEQTIINTIQKAYPMHGIMAEESHIQNPDAETVWIIDPIDGTTNYLHGFPFFSVSIAIQVKGKIEHGLIYDPLRHECFSASRGGGARLDDLRIRVSKRIQLKEALIGTGFPFRDTTQLSLYYPVFESLVGKCAGLRRSGSAALDLAYVAAGRLDGCWDMHLKLWDIAAGTLLIKEAGGLVADLQGGEDYLKTGSFIAGSPKIFKALGQIAMPLIRNLE